MDRNQPPQQRELVFCHQCENEWYRDEHGIICPECQSDFTEIVEENNDPREEPPNAHDFGGFYAPDPEEEDLSNFQWRQNGPGQMHGHGTFTRSFNLGGQPQGGQAGGFGGGLMGLIGPAIQNLLQPQQQQRQPGYGGQPGQQQTDNYPGSPGQQEGPRGVFTQHRSGPGYRLTVTTTDARFVPRDVNHAQPLQEQPENLDNMMAQMFMNIGVVPGGHFGTGGHVVGGMGGPTFVPAGGIGGAHGGIGGGHPGMGLPINLGALFNMLGMPPGGVHGDAVYSQEALDRIITQLMEQHQTGNAPGPASEEAIERLPKRKVTEKDIGDSGKADCSICMDEAEIGSTVTELPCGHWFHHDCIKAWLTEHDTCPHCRQGIMPKEQSNSNAPRTAGQAPLNNMHSPEAQRSRFGEYPFPPQGSAGPSGSGDGSRGNPNTMPGSSAVRRSESPRAERTTSGGIFNRMRDAFSPRDPPSNDNGNNH